jgi:hypothetical protein
MVAQFFMQAVAVVLVSLTDQLVLAQAAMVAAALAAALAATALDKVQMLVEIPAVVVAVAQGLQQPQEAVATEARELLSFDIKKAPFGAFYLTALGYFSHCCSLVIRLL